MARSRSAWFAALALTAMLGCVPGSQRSVKSRSGALAEHLRYEARLAQDLSQMHVKVCFKGPPASWLRPGKDEAGGRLLYARWLSPGAVRRLPIRNGFIHVDSAQPDGCLAYGVSLREGGPPGALIWRTERALIASPSAWLLRPQRRPADVRAELVLELPAGVAASLPWPQRRGHYLLDASAFRFDSYAAFGSFAPIRFAHRGVTIEAALLDDGLSLDRQGVVRWLKHAVDVAALANSGFPAHRLQLLLVSNPGADEAFGGLSRGGSASVFMLIPSDYDEATLKRDWVLIHELSHLQLPFVPRQDAWLSEGLATYYQEVLRARAGVQSEERALSRLMRAMHSAAKQGTGRPLREESRQMYNTRAFRTVYWAGAAYFLMADVTLRARSHGHQSLDTVLAALHRQGAASRVSSASDLLARLDELAGSPVFVPLAKRCLGRQFPDIDPVFDGLGARREQHTLVLDDAAPLAEVRRAIFAQPSPQRGSDSEKAAHRFHHTREVSVQ